MSPFYTDSEVRRDLPHLFQPRQQTSAVEGTAGHLLDAGGETAAQKGDTWPEGQTSREMLAYASHE